MTTHRDCENCTAQAKHKIEQLLRILQLNDNVFFYRNLLRCIIFTLSSKKNLEFDCTSISEKRNNCSTR